VKNPVARKLRPLGLVNVQVTWFDFRCWPETTNNRWPVVASVSDVTTHV
jgi:hypothetical protein